MTTTLQGGSADPPVAPSDALAIQAPPRLERPEGSAGVLTHAIPMLGGIGSAVVFAMASGSGAGGQGRGLLAAGAFLLTTVGFIAVQLARQRSQRARAVADPRTAYLRYLATVRATVRDAAAEQRTAQLWLHPDPSALPAVAREGTRVWERATTDAPFLRVRYGVGTQPLSLQLLPDDSPAIDEVDPVAASALHRLLAVHRAQPGLPAAVDLRTLDRIEVCGSRTEARSLARAMVCSAATFQSPEQLSIAVLATDGSQAQWDWVKWLPHAWSTCESDAAGPRRMVSTDLTDLTALVRSGDHAPDAHLLVVVDADAPVAGSACAGVRSLRGVTVLDLPSRWGELEDGRVLRLLFDDVPEVQDGLTHHRRPAISVQRVRTSPGRAVADQCPVSTAEALARRLTAAHRAPADRGVDASDTLAPPGLMTLLGLGDVGGYDPTTAWRARPARDRLRVPIGLGDGGGPVHLDLKESAQQGMGPHGLVVGATGSGKSELLRTLVLGLAVTHSPEQLTMVLVDFKGGATFAGMSTMPHVSALITNLESELTLVDRMQDALEGEMLRRQELLRDSGKHASVHDYERARAAGEPLAPLPSLFVVVDEFSELLSAKPEFLDLFVAIGRLGRSLGLHLLLASQRLEEGRLRGLEAHLSYRIGLRTFSAQESRAVLGVPDAYELPPVPGLGYLKPGRSTLLRFEAAYVSGASADSRTAATARQEPAIPRAIVPWTVSEVPVTPETQPPPGPEPAPRRVGNGEQRSLLEIAVARMEGHGPAAHPVWLPPLDVPETLDQLMPDLAPDPLLGLVSRQWRGTGDLTLPLGSVDRPRDQRRDPYTVTLSGATGHLAIVGGPRSGKSTALRTLVAALCLTTTPVESQVFVLDFGGGSFATMRSLPHVAGIGTRSEPDVVRRIVAEVTGVVDRREAYFRDQGIDSIETYRTRRGQGRADDGYGDVFLVVDGWGSLRADFDDLEPELQQLAARGLAFGFHVLTASSRWADYRAAVQDLWGTRLELRLGDPLDSAIDRRMAVLVPSDRPGRGLVPERLHVLTALPRIDGDARVATLADGIDAMVQQVTDAWRGPAGPKLRLLPELLTVDDLMTQAGRRAAAGRRLLLGVDEKELAPVSIDPGAEPHWLVFGDLQSGKSAALRTYLHEVMRTHTPKQAQLVVVDYRRSLLGEVPEEYLLDYLTSSTQATPTLADLASYLETRIAGPDVTAEQLRHRSWWSGAEVFVVVDDYDLVATSQGSPVQALQPLLAQARDVGLHLALTRRSGGASRALYEPVIQTLRDLSTPGLVLSGSPDEGALIGSVRPGPAPPGRGRLITRDRGVEVVQVAWREPSL